MTCWGSRTAFVLNGFTFNGDEVNFSIYQSALQPILCVPYGTFCLFLYRLILISLTSISSCQRKGAMTLKHDGKLKNNNKYRHICVCECTHSQLSECRLIRKEGQTLVKLQCIIIMNPTVHKGINVLVLHDDSSIQVVGVIQSRCFDDSGSTNEGFLMLLMTRN